MSRRFRQTLLGLALLALVLYVAPQLTPIRDGLLRLALGSLERSGYDVDFRESAGNPWRGLTLGGLKASGDDIDAAAQSLTVSYNLFALAGGRLPLSLSASGLRGDLDLAALLPQGSPGAEPQDTPDNAPRGFRITPVLKALHVEDTALTLRNVPTYAAPIDITTLEADQADGAITFQTGLRSGRAEAEASGAVMLEPFSLEAQIARADVALARPYYEGARGGSLRGTVKVSGGRTEADLELTQGDVDVVGIALHHVSGPVTLRDQIITTSLTGQALGGPLRGRGSVDLRAQHWEGDVRGNARLKEALVWLGQGRLQPQTVEKALGAKGGAEVALRLAGWQRFTLAGSALGAGELVGEPLRDLDVDFSFATHEGTRTTATARLGGEPLSFVLEPKGQGFTMKADGTDLPLYGFASDVDLDLEAQAGVLTGGADLVLTRTALGRALRLNVGATTDGKSWRADLSGRDARGARANGTVTLQGSEVQGAVTATGLELPGFATPLTVEASANGPLSDLPLTVRLSGPQGVHPAGGGVRAADDFSGTVRATFADGTVGNIRGALGPLELRGTLNDLRYTLSPTRLRGRVQGSVALQQGRLTRQGGTLTTQGRLETQDVNAAGITLPDLNAAATVGTGPLTARLTDSASGLDVTVQDGQLEGAFDGTELGALGETFAVTGSVSGRTRTLVESLELDLRARTTGAGPGTSLRAVGTGARTRVVLRSDASATLAGRTLGGDLDLTGDASLQERRAALAGTVGDLEVALDAAPDAEGRLQTAARLGSGPDAFSADFETPERWQTNGTLPLGELGRTFGLPLTGTLTSDLASQNGRFSGSATLKGNAFNVPLSLQAEGAGTTLDVVAETTLLEERLSLSGTVSPTADGPNLVAELDSALASGPVTVNAGGLTSTLTLTPALAALPDARATLELEATRDFSWRAVLQGDATLPYRNLRTELTGTMTGNGATYTGRGTLTLAGEPIGLEVSGEGSGVRATASLDGVALEPFVPATGTLSGDVRLTTAGAAGGPRYFANLSAQGNLSGRPFDLTLRADRAAGATLNGTFADIALSAEADLPLRRAALTLAAPEQPFDLTTFIDFGDEITLQGAGAWRGDALSASGSFTPRTGNGELRLALDDAELETKLTTREGARTLTAMLGAPQGLSSLTQPLKAEARVVLGSSVTVERFRTAVGTNRLDLTGTVRPETALSGTLIVPTADAAPATRPVTLTLRPLESSYLLALQQGNLILRGVLSPSFRPERVRLIGRQTRTLGGRNLELSSNLVWQDGQGFSGQSVLNLSGTSAATLTLEGEAAQGGLAGLRVTGEGRYRDVPVANLDTLLSAEPWRDRTLAGSLELGAPVARLVPNWPGEPMTLSAALDLSGTLTEPRLDGPLELAGAITARGRVAATRQGGTLELRGEGLDLEASADTAGYRSTLTLAALDLAGILPQVQSLVAGTQAPPMLSLNARAAQTWGGPPDLQVTGFDFSSARSSLRGTARYRGTLASDLELDIDVADFSPALRGRVRGPLTLDAGRPFDEALELIGLGPATADWTLGGTLAIGGTTRDPNLALDLSGAGSATGRLEAQLTPQRGFLDVGSTLSVAGLTTDLTLTRTERRLSAAGTLSYGAFGLTLSTRGERLRLEGRERLEGWLGTYGEGGLRLTGALDSLAPQGRGRITLSTNSRLQNLRGSLERVAFGPVTLGDLSLRETTVAGARALSLDGQALRGNVGLSGTLPWRLERLALALPGNVRVSATGEGSRTRGDLAATLSAAAYSFPVSASFASGQLALAARGELPLGTLELNARYGGGAWLGGVRVRGDAKDPVLASRLSGGLTTPRLAGTLELIQGGTSLTGTFDASQAGLALDSTLSSPRLTAPLRFGATGWPLSATLRSRSQALNLRLRDGTLESSGALDLSAGPAAVRLQSAEDTLKLRLASPTAPGLILRTDLPTQPAAYGALLDGLTLTGTGKTQGALTLALRPSPRATFDALRWQSAAGDLSLRGAATLERGLQADLSGTWRGSPGASVPWLREAVLPFTLRAQGGALSLASESDLGRFSAEVDLNERRGTLSSNLTLGRGRLESNLAYDPASGPDGTLTLTTLPIFTADDAPATLSAALALSPSGVSGNGVLRFAGSSAELSGQAGWQRLLPDALQRYAPQGGETLAAQVRLNRLELNDLPFVARRAPYLSAPVSGVATLTGTQLVGQVIAPELSVLATELPTQLDFNGTFGQLTARATVGDSRLNLTYNRAAGNSRLAGLVTLEAFPLQLLAEAATGASQVEASATGAARFDLPLANLRASYVRLATERLTLRSTATGTDGAATTTEGHVALRFERGSLYVERADFEGDGSWRARGVLTPETLDFTFDAQEANFSPLLRLVPRLATFGIGARGTVELRATGSAATPDISLTSPGLELSVAGGRYRVESTTASLRGETFTLESGLVGVSPIGGTINLRGSGAIGLNPVTTRDLELRFSGDATIPTLGRVTALRGRLYPSISGWQLNGRGAIGQPFTVTGPLAPLDLRLSGRGLDIRAPRYFLDSSSTNADVRVRANEGNFDISGSVVATTAQLSLEREQASAQAAAAPNAESAQAGSSGSESDDPSASDAGTLGSTLDSNIPDGDSPGSDIPGSDIPGSDIPGSDTSSADIPTPEATPPGSATATALGRVLTRPTNPALERVRFVDLRLRAPGQVFFESGFGNAELSADVTLSGTAAAPRLSGEAHTLQGTVNFSGQEFSVQQATATFDPTQGVYPTLELDAEVTFDKAQALGTLDDQGYNLVDPPGSTFVAQLAFSGAFRRSASGRRTLDLEPTLTSNAALQEGTTNPRPLNETELLTLLTLGRLQLDAPIVGTNGLAETVATTALDTAVDLYLISELQNALSEVLGVNLEIRTSSLSSVLGPDPQAFGVSVKLGGYLSDNLFASVQVGRFDDPDRAYALTNEFSLRYTANPLEINLAGGVNFGSSRSAVTDFSLGFSYALTTNLSLDASLATEDSGRDTNFGFGVSYTW